MNRVALGVVVLAPLVASAGRHIDDGARLEGGLGVRFGTMMIDNRPDGVIPMHLDVGMRDDRLLLYGEYELALPTYHGPSSPARGELDVGRGAGMAHRFTANARYSIGRTGGHDGGGDVWAELGGGFERIAWDAGGVWTRPELALGIGLAVWGADERDHGGLSLGLRATFAPRNDVAFAPAICGGPCDMATPPTGWDRALMFDLTAQFGR